MAARDLVRARGIAGGAFPCDATGQERAAWRTRRDLLRLLALGRRLRLERGEALACSQRESHV